MRRQSRYGVSLAGSNHLEWSVELSRGAKAFVSLKRKRGAMVGKG